MTGVEDLRTLVLRRSAELGDGQRPISSREAAARSNGSVSRATIDNIKGGRHSGRIDDRTVDGLALAFDVKRSDILRAMNRSQLGALRPFEAPDRWRRLTHSERRVVLSVGDALLAAYERGRMDEADSQGSGERPLRAVASGQRSSDAPKEARDKARRARQAQQQDEP